MKGPLPESGNVDGLDEDGLGELAECGRRGKLYAGVDGKCPPEVGEGAIEGEMPGAEAILSKSFWITFIAAFSPCSQAPTDLLLKEK